MRLSTVLISVVVMAPLLARLLAAAAAVQLVARRHSSTTTATMSIAATTESVTTSKIAAAAAVVVVATAVECSVTMNAAIAIVSVRHRTFPGERRQPVTAMPILEVCHETCRVFIATAHEHLCIVRLVLQ